MSSDIFYYSEEHSIADLLYPYAEGNEDYSAVNKPIASIVKSYPSNDRLDDLMKVTKTDLMTSRDKKAVVKKLSRKYKSYIPFVPPRKQRSRPICMFVNYLGTRKNASVMEPTAHPTEEPPMKRQRFDQIRSYQSTPKPLEVSHYPTLHPTGRNISY